MVAIETQKTTAMPVAYSGMLLNAGMVSSEVKRKALAVTPPPRPMMNAPVMLPARIAGMVRAAKRRWMP